MIAIIAEIYNAVQMQKTGIVTSTVCAKLNCTDNC